MIILHVCFQHCDVLWIYPVSLIQNLCGISVEGNKLVWVLDLYWGAGAVAWLWWFHPLRKEKNYFTSAFIKLATRGQTNIKNWQHPTSIFPSVAKTLQVSSSNLMLQRYRNSTHHSFSPGADISAGWMFRYINPQVAVWWVEPPSPLSLLLLRHELEGATQTQLIVFRWNSGDRGRDLHVVLGSGFFTHYGVPVRVSCSVALESQPDRKHCANIQLSLGRGASSAVFISIPSQSFQQ